MITVPKDGFAVSHARCISIESIGSPCASDHTAAHAECGAATIKEEPKDGQETE